MQGAAKMRTTTRIEIARKCIMNILRDIVNRSTAENFVKKP